MHNNKEDSLFRVLIKLALADWHKVSILCLFGACFTCLLFWEKSSNMQNSLQCRGDGKWFSRFSASWISKVDPMCFLIVSFPQLYGMEAFLEPKPMRVYHEVNPIRVSGVYSWVDMDRIPAFPEMNRAPGSPMAGNVTMPSHASQKNCSKCRKTCVLFGSPEGRETKKHAGFSALWHLISLWWPWLAPPPRHTLETPLNLPPPIAVVERGEDLPKAT